MRAAGPPGWRQPWTTCARCCSGPSSNGEIDLGLEVGAALWRWWLISGRLSAGRAWLDKFLTAAGEHPVRTAEEAEDRASAVRGRRAGRRRTATTPRRFAWPGERWASSNRSSRGEDLALAATVLGSAQRYLGERAEARRSFQTALDLRAAVGRPGEAGHGDQQHGPGRARRRESRPGQGAARAEPRYQAPARGAALGRDRPDQPGRGADPGRPVAGRPCGNRRGRRAGRRPASDHGLVLLQPGPPRGPAAELGAGGRALPGGGGRLPGGRPHARRGRGHDRVGPRPLPARPGRRGGPAARARRRRWLTRSRTGS